MIRVALAQLNPTVGALEANSEAIIAKIREAEACGAHVVCFSELVVTGYPPEDLLLRPSFIQGNLLALEKVAAATGEVIALVGFVDRADDLYNAAAVCHRGRVVGVYHKGLLPTYGVFDEDRYFQTGGQPLVVETPWGRFGVTVCEDIWYASGPALAQARAGAQIVFNLSSSPYQMAKGALRETMLATRASDSSAFLVYVNQVGGQDELVFDGQSLVFNPDGQLLARGKIFEEDFLVADLDLALVEARRLRDTRWRKEKRRQAVDETPTVVIGADKERVVTCDARRLAPLAPPPGLEAEVYGALKLGLRDYVLKNGFQRVVLGVSGGIDSALVAALAADALGPEQVTGVVMPSCYSSPETQADARTLCRNLRIPMQELPIEGPFLAFEQALEGAFAGWEADVTEENLQARVRGTYLMALSNKFGWLVLATSNKSEVATGYGTLYGDMAGGLMPIKDVPKTLVYRLARYRNQVSPVIPLSIIERAPTAELRPGQTDQDTLPPYDDLDRILEAYVEDDLDLAAIAELGFARALVEQVANLVAKNEYKRRQAAPGIKVTERAFGKDRRWPITNRYREKL